MENYNVLPVKFNATAVLINLIYALNVLVQLIDKLLSLVAVNKMIVLKIQSQNTIKSLTLMKKRLIVYHVLLVVFLVTLILYNVLNAVQILILVPIVKELMY